MDLMKKKLYVCLEPKIIEKLDKLAKMNRRSKSNMIEVMVEDFFERL